MTSTTNDFVLSFCISITYFVYTLSRIAEMNREYFEEFQTQSSKMLPDFRANYNMEHVGDLFKSWLASLPPK